MVLLSDWNAAACVRDGDLHIFRMSRPFGGADQYLAALRCKFDGVVQQIDDDLGDSAFVQRNLRQVRVHILEDRDVPGRGGSLDAEDSPLQQYREGRRFEIQGHFAGFQTRGVEQIIEAEAQLVTAIFGDAQVLSLIWGERSRQTIEHDGNEFSSRGEGGLELVGKCVVEVLNLPVSSHQVLVGYSELRLNAGHPFFCLFFRGDVRLY